MKHFNFLRIYRIILVILIAMSLTVEVANSEITTVTYQVSAWVDNAFTSQHVQYMSYIYLRVGYRNEESPPYTMCAMRFKDVNVPQGMLILDARLKIRAYSTPVLEEPLYGVIHAEDADNPADFSGRNIRDIVKTDTEVNWDHIPYWEDADLYTSPDISAMVQEVIDRLGWSVGNAMVITYSNRLSAGNYRQIISYEFPSSPPHYGAPILEITYGEPPISDFDEDGTVGPDDLKIFTEQYLQGILYYESDGQVVIEAERYFNNHQGSGLAEGITWIDFAGEGAMGEGFLQALPDGGININGHSDIEANSPHLSYQVDFNTPGPDTTYYLWVKGMAEGSSSNSIHYGLDGVSISSENANAPQLVQGDAFAWLSETNDGSIPEVTVPSAGIHTLDIWMREDGAKIDRLLLTTDVDYDPETNEPEESPHQPLDLTADLNFDGTVNLLDFAVFAEDWLWPWME